MSIIKCPVCRGQVSTMAGTCPHCGIKISSQLRKCPECGGYCLESQEECPECGKPLQPTPAPSPVPSPAPSPEQQDTSHEATPRKKKKKSIRWGCLFGTLLLLALLSAGGYFYYQQYLEQKEQADYERLADVTNPEFYQQFLLDYPESKHYDEIKGRMLALQTEAKDWEQLQKDINRTSLSRFMQKYPATLRLRACEDMLDSIDWNEAQADSSEEAMTDYLAKHPSGSHVTEAAEMKNALLLAKVTPAEREVIRGTLEAFFSKAIGKQDMEAALEAIPDSMQEFCGKKQANAETVVQYGRDKMEKDVIGLHYAIGQQMEIRKETLPDGNTGFAVEVGVQETISRSDTSRPSSNLYRITALISQEQKIVKMNIYK